ncbi:MAG: 30S ribosomal protein S6 [Candidatus Levybacteria bacterium GW2011_GWB1_35_5]|nr:MAG: 30S ribosomal protein S6 [Candidatus Levybacteria bacterium GW2011_GWB1_35_5]
MRNYQLILVLKASLTEANRKKLLETVKGFLKSGKVSKQEDLGEKQLAYPIKKEGKGVYFNFLFETDENLKEMEKNLISNEDILRSLLLRV